MFLILKNKIKQNTHTHRVRESRVINVSGRSKSEREKERDVCNFIRVKNKREKIE